MGLYSILLLPSLVLMLFSTKLTRAGLGVVWFSTSVMMLWLVPIGSRDYSTYVAEFLSYRNLGILDVITKDPLYATSSWAFGKLGGSPEVYFSFFIFFAFLTKLTALKRLGASTAVIFLYISSYLILHEFTQVRAALAIGLIMHALVDFSLGRKRFIVLTVVASLIHIQALLGFILFSLMWFSRFRGTKYVLLCVFVLGVSLGLTGAVDQVLIAVAKQIPDVRADVYVQMAEEDYWEKPNPFSLINLLGSSVAVACALFSRHSSEFRASISPSNTILHGVSISLFLGVLAFTTLGSVSVAAFRISEHFFALLPIGVGLVLKRLPLSPRLQQCILLALGVLMFYIFIFHSEYLRNPITGD